MNKKVIGVIIAVVIVLSTIIGVIVLVSNDNLNNKTIEKLLLKKKEGIKNGKN